MGTDHKSDNNTIHKKQRSKDMFHNNSREANQGHAAMQSHLLPWNTLKVQRQIQTVYSDVPVKVRKALWFAIQERYT